ncbi:MAG: heavy-metal-associated domain-containing protein [Bacteroidota bacterium]
MANLDRNFDIIGKITNADQEGIMRAVGALDGVNSVKVDPATSKVSVSYTPGIINIQNIKEAIESQGVDVSDRGDD